MELYIVRHGQTDWNKETRFQGLIDKELNSEGRESAAKLGEKLEKENIFFDKIYSSPLCRAYETACLIRGRQNIPIIRDSRLKEICFGVLEGLTYDDWMNTELPRKNFFTNPENYIPPKDGESFESVCKRTKEFIQEVLEKSTDKKVLLVAHGALLAGLTCYLENRPISNYWGNGLTNNCETKKYVFDGNLWLK